MNTVLTNACLAACSFIVAVGVAEGWARMGEQKRLRIPHATRHHALKPLDESFQEAWGNQKVYMAVNSLGMRDLTPRVVPLRQPGSTRILFLGDSFTEGVGVRFEDTFAHQVQLRLDRQSGLQVESLNAGVASYSPLLEFVTLKELLATGLTVNGVVLAADASDPQDELLYRAYFGTRYEMARSDSPSSPTFPSRLFNNIYGNSAVFRRVAFRLATRALERETAEMWRAGSIADRESWLFDPELIRRWGKPGVELMKENIHRMSDYLKRRSIPFLLLIYPRPLELQRREPSLYELELRELVRQDGLCAADLYQSFRSLEQWQPYFIEGDVHWTPRGHELVAETLVAIVADGLNGTGCFALGH